MKLLAKPVPLRAIIHYALAALILSVYSGKVCPYMARLEVSGLIVSLVVSHGIVFIVRNWFLKAYVESAPYDKQLFRQFIIEKAMFLTAAFLVAMYNMFFNDIPFESGFKLIIGSLTLGFFAAIDMVLERERNISKELAQQGLDIMLKDKPFTMTKKFALVATCSVVFSTTVIFLVVSLHLKLLVHANTANIAYLQRAVLFEVVYVSSVILIEIINLIISYSKNLNLFFYNQNNALTSVANGNLQSKVTVSTNDEFGIMALYTNKMIQKLKERTDELQLTQDVTIQTLASLAETRDGETGAHIIRTQRYIRSLANCLKKDARFKDILIPATIDLLFKSAPLHDIGKVGVKDNILKKPGRLTDEEFEEMKKHTIYGRDALKSAEGILGTNSFLKLAGEIAYSHHEKWDGTGYPEGLKGNNIPLSGRLMAIADVYDALRSKRVYKGAFSHEEASRIIQEGKGKHFDPDIVEAFIAVEEEFLTISLECADKQNIEKNIEEKGVLCPSPSYVIIYK
ncbi:MAG: HD domain-containing protein [Candidatus Magnetoovum sp. WYHC-5]|nr:HD domain-containing protein [Candidatus Magnetoovum sp. WYHC-5]